MSLRAALCHPGAFYKYEGELVLHVGRTESKYHDKPYLFLGREAGGGFKNFYLHPENRVGWTSHTSWPAKKDPDATHRPFTSCDELREKRNAWVIFTDGLGFYRRAKIDWYNDTHVAVGGMDAISFEQAFKQLKFDVDEDEDPTFGVKLPEPPAPPAPPEIRPCIVISTRHISMTTNRWLTSQGLANAAEDITAASSDVAIHHYGYYGYVHDEYADDYPEDFCKLLDFAKACGATYYKLDGDGPEYDELERFNWK